MSQQPNKAPNQSSDNKHYAKSLVGFLSGLVLATLIIVAVLLMINSNSKKTFKPTEPVLSNNTPPATQTLTPSMGSGVVAHNDNVSPPATTNDNNPPAEPIVASTPQKTETTTLPNPVKPTIADTKQPPQANADTRFNEPTFEEDDKNEPTFAPQTPKVKPRETKPVRQEQVKPAVKQPAKVATAPNKNPAAPKPTPQQILDNGNIEKAREAAKREQIAKNTKNSGSQKGGNVVLQAGSFNSRDYAESQRAKLAMLGVQAQIAEAKVNGKTVYRVQTPKLNTEKANDAKAVMRLNGVGVYERHE